MTENKKTRAEMWQDLLEGIDAMLEKVQSLKTVVEETVERDAKTDGNALFTPAPPIVYNRNLFTGSKN